MVVDKSRRRITQDFVHQLCRDPFLQPLQATCLGLRVGYQTKKLLAPSGAVTQLTANPMLQAQLQLRVRVVEGSRHAQAGFIVLRLSSETCGKSDSCGTKVG